MGIQYAVRLIIILWKNNNSVRMFLLMISKHAYANLYNNYLQLATLQRSVGNSPQAGDATLMTA